MTSFHPWIAPGCHTELSFSGLHFADADLFECRRQAVDLTLLSVFELLQLLGQARRAKHAAQPLGNIPAADRMIAEAIERIALGAGALIEQTRQRAGAEHPAIAAAKTKEAVARTIATTVAAAEHLRDVAWRQRPATHENVPQWPDAV